MNRLGTLTLLAAVLQTGCLFERPAVVVNAGPSTPIEERVDPSPFDRLPERTVVVGYEFGVCNRDSDCAPRGCDQSVCSPAEQPSVCLISGTSECLSQIDPSFCGCDEGVCRWARRPEVYQCAMIDAPPASTRGFEGHENDWYPVHPGY